nr:AAA family ATPase [Celeribacter baekdonensis]
MPRIPFADVRFLPEDLPTEFELNTRLKRFLRRYRENMENPPDELGLSEEDRAKIERRTQKYLRTVANHSGLAHLDRKDRARLEVFRKGAMLMPVETEHRADEIASAIHTAMPWMAPATDRLWQDMRASVRNGDPAPRLRPMLLVGPPGIGKSHFARLLGDLLSVPTTIIEATGEPAPFAVTGSQRGWGSASPGKVLEGIMASQIANPVIVIDEIEKAGVSSRLAVNAILWMRGCCRCSKGLPRATGHDDAGYWLYAVCIPDLPRAPSAYHRVLGGQKKEPIQSPNLILNLPCSLAVGARRHAFILPVDVHIPAIISQKCLNPPDEFIVLVAV